ncbi:MAG: peptide deformylase [Myxococcota bacterium]
MTLRKIAEIGHPLLRERAREVGREELATKEVQELIDDLIATMRDANGAGLAAPQVLEPLRICVIEVGENPRYPYKPRIPLTVLVNPVLVPMGQDTFGNYEGCLSVPNLRGLVERHAELRVRAVDRNGAPIDKVVRGLTAGTYQHECDHLDGVLFVDRVKDPKSFCTWQEFDRHHRAAFVETASHIVARFGE